MAWGEVVFGRKLDSSEIRQQQIGSLVGVSLLGLDALSSVAYGPEAALTILIPLGLVGFHFIWPLTLSIVALLLIVFFSYLQTIAAYPNGGGSYTVAKENLGSEFGLIAAAGLCIDYILNVAVAISAGVGALVSAVPVLFPYTLSICLIVLAFFALINLRGVREAGNTFFTPTYLFIFCLLLALGVGIYNITVTSGNPVPLEPLPKVTRFSETFSIWIIIRAFASGCSALTGVEAVSNGVPLFKDPSVLRAKITLSIIVITLVVFLLGIAFVAQHYHITATVPGQSGYESILSQLFRVVLGKGPFYYLAIAAVISVLMLSAITSYAGFPGICRLLSLDHFLPEGFSRRGRRLVYSEGIYVLTIIAAALLIAFKGITDKLIPLFAIGAFVAFTLSQTGMVVHWWKRRNDKRVWASMVMNFIGATCTCITLFILFIFKFTEGAWLTLLAIPAIVIMFQRERAYNERISQQVQLERPIDLSSLEKPIILLPIRAWDRTAEKGLQLAFEISKEIYVVHVITGDENIEELKDKWEFLAETPARNKHLPVPKLIILTSKYREVFEPLLDFIALLKKQSAGRKIGVIIPQLIELRWYHYIFRNSSMLLESSIIWNCGPEVFVISAPWYVFNNDKESG